MNELLEAAVEWRHVSEFLNHFLLGRQAYNGEKYHVLTYSAPANSALYCVPFRSSVFRLPARNVINFFARSLYCVFNRQYRLQSKQGLFTCCLETFFYVYVYIWLVCVFKQYLFVYFLYLLCRICSLLPFLGSLTISIRNLVHC